MNQEEFNQAIEKVIADSPSDMSPLDAAAFAYVNVLAPFITNVIVVDGVVAFGMLPFILGPAQRLCDHMRGYFGTEEFDHAVSMYVMATMADVAIEQALSQFDQPKQSPYAGGMYLN